MVHWACLWSSPGGKSTLLGGFRMPVEAFVASPDCGGTVAPLPSVSGAGRKSLRWSQYRRAEWKDGARSLERRIARAGREGGDAEEDKEKRGVDMVVSAPPQTKRRPVLLVDVMDTIVRDPFHVDMPAFFGITFKELMAGKHPTAWIEFENGLLNEDEFAAKLFNDRRDYDYEGLKRCMSSGYEYIEGMEQLLQRLKAADVDMHVLSNYPTWYTMIEDKLKVSKYLPWTFVSCHTGMRKPSPEAFLDAVEWLGVCPEDCIFIDDQLRNVEAASKAGMTGLRFQNARTLEKELAAHGINLDPCTRAQKAW